MARPLLRRLPSQAVAVLLCAFILVAACPVLALQECAYITIIDGCMVTIDTTTRAIAARVPFDRYLNGPIAVTPGGGFTFVASPKRLYILDTGTNLIAATVPLGIYGAGPIAFLPDGSIAYATGTYEPLASSLFRRVAVLFVIDVGTHQVLTTVDQAENATSSPDGRTVYAIRTGATEPPRLLLIDPSTLEIIGIVPNVPYAETILVTSDGRSVYLRSIGSPHSRITRIDATTHTVAGSIDVTGELTDLSVSSDGTMGYGTTYNTDIGAFVVFDLPSGKEIGRVMFQGIPDAFAMTGDQRRAYVLLREDVRRQHPAVGVIDVANRTVEATIPLPGSGMDIDIATVPRGCSAKVCEGDCDANGQVTVDEILAGIGMALGEPFPFCAAYAGADTGTVSIDAIVRAVNNAVNGCP